MAVTGDPAGMRAAAAQLRFRAERFEALARDVDDAVHGTQFTGPAAKRWRGAIDDHGARLRLSASRLQDAADALVREAAFVETEQQRGLTDGGWVT